MDDEGTGAQAPLTGGVTRRVLLRDGTAATVAVLLAGSATATTGDAIAVGLRADGRAAFLTAAELRTLRALCAVLIPTDDLPGAADAGCPEAIDALLSAFAVSPPRIWAGGGFSDRGGAPRNDFVRFLELDRYERRAWRIRIEGTRGLPRLEWAGPVRGWQAVYRDGLAALDRAARGDFAALPVPAADALLRTSRDPDVQELLDVAFPHAIEFLYGAPEYGGNRDLAGWRAIGYDGDTLPRGYTPEQIAAPPEPGLAAVPAEILLGLLDLAPLAGSSELVHGLTSRSGERLSDLRADLGALGDLDGLGARLAALQEEVRRGA
ncbi:hypothetical protein GKE82_12515 [Conexibacter sp. W3-3-2]|uniref:gluconate 2-dehydrogenase subunit 3 family protein n=1 Tax=Conexibacter sp. W3-3-2 TaxID=2675227 RepID=UPI0012B8FE90|nr:gluconate 2-dehydrogenase subunit 3 family protein [Conexibacter sp. W3-3-2]MTD45092.1 hypothetical protein [Conexibacter sp. W3-3-2]